MIKIEKIIGVYPKDKNGNDQFENGQKFSKVLFKAEGNENALYGKDFTGKYIVGAEIEGSITSKDYNGKTMNFFNEPRTQSSGISTSTSTAKPITVGELALVVEILRIKVNNVLDFIDQYKNGKIPADFSTDRVQARKEQIESAQKVGEKVDSEEEIISPEDIPF